ncbi:hypothetical protein [Nonomuraea helvata]|uniref:Uncharacterized protein n=1 Tax=Nonomuraea helvata TaxID=37484 RepID=A0ABV5SE58_9ACTN
MKSLMAGLTSVATAAVLLTVTAPSASAATYTLLAQNSRGGVTAKLWRNNQTGAVHAQGLNLRAGEIARLDLYQGITRAQNVLQPNRGTKLDTSSVVVHPPESYSACAGSPAGGTRFVCTVYYRINR